jgi:methyl-accepting chemotaxis protein
MRGLYEAHRKEIDKLVLLTEKKNAEIERSTAVLLKNTRILLVSAVLFVLAVCGVIIPLIVRNVTGAFSMCADIADRVASGDLTVHVPVMGKGNVYRMLTSLNAMVDNLNGIIGEVKNAAVRIDESAGRLSSGAEQIAASAEEVNSQVGGIATAGEEMAATSVDIARNCGMVAEEAKQANDSAIQGNGIVRNTIRGMEQIAARVKESAQTIDALGERSDQIGEIVGTIEDIADQTNLLALNAAIEAARAGEQGRGFAVVADEVRALAERTTKATREIDAMIRSIQSETRSAVTAMEEGVREVEQGTAEAEKSGAALEHIQQQIDALTVQVSQIATAAEQQTATTSEISGNMHHITSLVGESVVGAQESARAAVSLARLAENLQQVVGRFKVL